MKLTTRGRYALQALVDLITHSGGKPVKLADISERQGLSRHYLEQLFRKLRNGGVVKSARGPGGGYVLTQDPSQIMIVDVLRSVEKLTAYADVVLLPQAPSREAVCSHKLVTRLDEATGRVLAQPLKSLL